MALRCLLVDDSARFLQAARALLEREGLVVDIALTGADALRRAGAFRPDVVLVDIDLGDESGFELARRLDEHRFDDRHTTGGPGIIMVSTHQREDFEELIADSPALGFLAKSALSASAVHELLLGPSGQV
ncbi:response regulator [Kutzneria sp. CA-103260]|uniref:response regulator n=1 Tax=Kutzneria sp. CA-103260 TaxID=2802641 RepID=UPI001BA550EA|nr:response regulator [Kutzneria sp. CA-103260]QUQ68785.1 nitrate/nitrite response regulator protein [Kutzneria sp. CA-103260]